MVKVNFLHLRSTISTMVRKIAVDVVIDVIMAGARTYWRSQVVIDRLAQRKLSVRRPKSLFFSYFGN